MDMAMGSMHGRDAGVQALTEEANHRKARMLDLGGLQPERPVVIASGQVQGVEEATGVQALLGVQLGVTVHLSTTHSQGLDPDQLRDGEGQRESKVGGTVQLNLASIHPAVDFGEMNADAMGGRTQHNGNALN
jgi:hypothetical protein